MLVAQIFIPLLLLSTGELVSFVERYMGIVDKTITAAITNKPHNANNMAAIIDHLWNRSIVNEDLQLCIYTVGSPPAVLLGRGDYHETNCLSLC